MYMCLQRVLGCANVAESGDSFLYKDSKYSAGVRIAPHNRLSPVRLLRLIDFFVKNQIEQLGVRVRKVERLSFLRFEPSNQALSVWRMPSSSFIDERLTDDSRSPS